MSGLKKQGLKIGSAIQTLVIFPWTDLTIFPCQIRLALCGVSFLHFEALSAISGDAPMTHHHKSCVDVRDKKNWELH